MIFKSPMYTFLLTAGSAAATTAFCARSGGFTADHFVDAGVKGLSELLDERGELPGGEPAIADRAG